MNKKDLKMIEEALKKSPNNIALRLTYALKLFKLREFDLSEKNYQVVLKSDPANTKAKQGLVELYFAKGNYSAVIVIAEELVKIGAASEKMMELYAKALLRQNSIAEAQEIYERIIKNNPFYFDEELDSVLEDQDEYLHDEEFGDGEDEFDYDEDEMDDIFDNPFFTDDSYLFLDSNAVQWNKIIGMEEIKKLVEYKSYILTPELSKQGQNNKFNLLLYGPPGCGKTYFAAALANRFDASVLPVEMDRVNDMFMYKAEGRIQYYFAKMRLNKPCILIIDELERFGTSQEIFNSFENMQVIGKLVEELDGVRYKNSEQFIVSATNRPWQIEQVLFSPGKFGWNRFVGPPAFKERVKYFESIKNQHQFSALEIGQLATATKFFSFAELNHLIDMAKYEAKTKAGRKKTKLTFAETESLIAGITPFAPNWIEIFMEKAPAFLLKEVTGFMEKFD
ncbi:MAG TPA: AAA family ATPase [Saprospiraceae bacterium]|nr:AAA family ATPase [Saprospiraceae bacterium]HPN68330.1 AAA family ATPase [Saprospiraceae bacterium]